MLDTNQMARLTKGLSSKSEKMRTLAKAGYSRSDIARFLDVRYQFVRNVLVREEERQAGSTGKGEPEGAVSSELSSRPNRVRLGVNGEIALPEKVRDALRLKAGDTLIVSLEDDEIRLMTVATAVRKVQALVRQYVPEGVSLVDELLEDRRREADGENGG